MNELFEKLGTEYVVRWNNFYKNYDLYTSHWTFRQTSILRGAAQQGVVWGANPFISPSASISGTKIFTSPYLPKDTAYIISTSDKTSVKIEGIEE